ncbi:MAG: FkbM family methyltransferase [Usitatibacter sp.]
MPDALPKIDPAEARRWRPVSRSPEELRLRCEGGFLARLATRLHFAWPFSRGHWRFIAALARIPPLERRLRCVAFRSRCGVALRLDIPTLPFLYLAGRLATEPHELAIMSRLVRDGDVFVDVGAHWGLYIPHILGRLGSHGRYLAIEPSAANHAFLARTFGPDDPRLELLRIAASDQECRMYLRGGDTSEAFISTAAGDDHQVVEARRLDGVLAELPADRTVVIKIDSEGHEAAVIRGCAGLAGKGITPIFLLEYLVEIRGQTRSRIVEAIGATFGPDYALWAISPAKGALVRLESDGRTGDEVRNVLAIASRERHRIEPLLA